MLEFVFIGRGGQGVVLAEEILAGALFYQGFHVKSFPAFGTERRGAPVMAFLRVSEDPIHESFQIYHPDYYIIFDTSRQPVNDLLTGGLINSAKPTINSSMVALDAGRIALNNNLGTETNPIINTAMLGGIGALLKQLDFKYLEKSIIEKLPDRLHARNIQAAKDAWKNITSRHEVDFWKLKCA